MSMRRREIIALLGGAVAWPLAARAQQRALPVVGFLFSGTPEENADEVAALRGGLSEAGFTEGRNVAFEYRWDRSDAVRSPANAADFVKRRVAVIATNIAGGALLAKAATPTIPIVFVASADAVQVGLVASLARPGANVTGVNMMAAALGEKRFELLHELLPQAKHFGVLVNSAIVGSDSDIAQAQAAAKALGLSLEVLTATNNREIDAAFSRAAQQQVDALVVARAQLFLDRRVQLTTLAVRHALPTMFFSRKFAAAGGLMSYAANSDDQFRQAGIYVGRILKGEKPADLPVVQPTKFELVINLQTARTLGLDVPPTLLALADEVID